MARLVDHLDEQGLSGAVLFDGGQKRRIFSPSTRL
jgi:hypothetical protein